MLISDGKHYFAHSGDLRLYGDHYNNVKKWIHEFKQLNLDLFLLEGTSFSFLDEENNQVEQPHQEVNREVECGQRFLSVLKSLTSVPVVNLYSRNIERLIRFQKIAVANKRPIVWEPAMAQLLKYYLPLEQIFSQQWQHQKQQTGIQTITWEQFNTNPQKFTVQNSFVNLEKLTQLRNFAYLHADGGPLGEYDADYQQMKKFLVSQNATYQRVGASGHATRVELLEVAKLVHAKKRLDGIRLSPKNFQIVYNIVD